MRFARPLSHAPFLAVLSGAVVLLLGFLLTPTSARAQSTWTQVPAPSATFNSTLWGVCFGGGQFVAVGEHGTILTSPDGLTWTPRASGTAAWLTSVAYGYHHYVAVGDNRTLLVSLDAVTWEAITRFPDRTPIERLNVVTFASDRFYAFGEHDFAVSLTLPPIADWRDPSPVSLHNTRTWWRATATGLSHQILVGETGLAVYDNPDSALLTARQSVTLPPAAATRALSGVVFDHDTFTAVGDTGIILNSVDALTWTLQSTPTTTNLSAIAAFNNSLIAVGASGTVLTSADRRTWSARTVPSAELLLAIAASDTAAVIVGGSGTILRATPTPSAPAIAAAPAAVTESIGGAASFVVRALGSLPLTYQWSRNGTTLAGETNADLIRSPLAASDAGDYTVTVANSAGTVTSAPATLSLLPATRAVVDPAFRAAPAFTGDPVALLTLPDDSVLVATRTNNSATPAPAVLVKLTSTGAIDPGWPAHTFSAASGGSSNVSLTASPSVLLLQPDGRILVGGSFYLVDGLFAPNLFRLNRDGSLDPSFTPPPAVSSAAAYAVASLALQADGKILVANGGPAPLRLFSDGRLDSSFSPAPLPPVGPPEIYENRYWSTAAVSVSPDGRIFAGYNVNLTATLIARRSASTVARFLPDGTTDATFSVPRAGGVFVAFRALDDGGLLWLAGDPVISNFGVYDTHIVRFRADGTPYPGHLRPLLGSNFYRYIYPDGRIVVTNPEPGSTQVTFLSPTRYTALGAIDPTFTGGIGAPTLFAPASGDRLYVAGNFTVYDGTAANYVARLNSVTDDTLAPPRLLSFTVDKTTATIGDTITVRAAVIGSGALVYDWTGAPGVSQPNIVLRGTSPVLRVPITVNNQFAHYVQLTVRNSRGQATSARLDLTLQPSPAVITAQPTRVSAQSGRTFTLIVNATYAGTIAYEWRHDGQILPGLPNPSLTPSLTFPSVTPADAGTYTVTLRNALGEAVTSDPIVVAVDDTSRFINLSTRVVLTPDAPSATAGFVIPGTIGRTILLRGIGPALSSFGVTAALPDPQLTLFSPAHDGLPPSTTSMDDWPSDSNSGPVYTSLFKKVGAFPLAAGSKDSAFIMTLIPGAYTVQLNAKPGQSGTALIEIYEADNENTHIVNLSTRASVALNAPAIAGFAISGTVAKTVLLRAAGPTLAAFGVPGPLAHPRLTLKNSAGATVAINSAWGTAPDQIALARATLAAGAFAFASGSADAALLLTLAPGNYTALVESADATSGIALVEVYEVP